MDWLSCSMALMTCSKVEGMHNLVDPSLNFCAVLNKGFFVNSLGSIGFLLFPGIEKLALKCSLFWQCSFNFRLQALLHVCPFMQSYTMQSNATLSNFLPTRQIQKCNPCSCSTPVAPVLPLQGLLIHLRVGSHIPVEGEDHRLILVVQACLLRRFDARPVHPAHEGLGALHQRPHHAPQGFVHLCPGLFAPRMTPI